MSSIAFSNAPQNAQSSSVGNSAAVAANFGYSQAVILSGTFKSMLNPNITGDITICIPNVSDLNQLLQTLTVPSLSDSAAASDSNSAPPSPANDVNGGITAPSNVVYKSGEFNSLVQLIFRSSSPTVVDQSPSVQQKRQFHSRGKICVSSLARVPSSAMHSTPSPLTKPDLQNAIKQYDMMFVQSDFEPGQSFFSVTFSKTLVENCGLVPVYSIVSNGAAEDYSGSLLGSIPERGLMLSGHYSCLRSYDVGTVRIHLPSSA
jgi:hypothetical protein